MKTRSRQTAPGADLPRGTGLAGSAAAGKKRGGRKNKEAWRKNVDIRDVEEFLEDQRLEERLGKFGVKQDSELFTIDTTGEVATDTGGEVTGKKVLSAKQRKRAALAATPKCYEVLLSTSKVEDPNAKRNTVNPAGVRPTSLSRLAARRRDARGIADKKLAMTQANRQRVREERRRVYNSRRTFDIDVWEDVPSAKSVEPTLQSEWFSEEVVRLNVPAERRVRLPRATRALPRPLPPALPPPHPGQSYNPSYEDHQALLRQVADKERELIKKEKHLARVTTNMFKLVRKDQRETEWLKEMMSGLPSVPSLAPPASGTTEDSDDGSDTEYAAVNPPVKNKKKDNKARRKQRERKVEDERTKRAKVDKRKIADIYKLRFLERAITAADERLDKLRSLRTQRRTERLAAEPPLLNAHKPRVQEEAFLLPSELAPALRSHNAAGTNLLRERFESLQRRGALAPSRVFLRKKLRLKTYFKSGHKVTKQDVNRYIQENA